MATFQWICLCYLLHFCTKYPKANWIVVMNVSNNWDSVSDCQLMIVNGQDLSSVIFYAIWLDISYRSLHVCVQFSFRFHCILKHHSTKFDGNWLQSINAGSISRLSFMRKFVIIWCEYWNYICKYSGRLMSTFYKSNIYFYFWIKFLP